MYSSEENHKKQVSGVEIKRRKSRTRKFQAMPRLKVVSLRLLDGHSRVLSNVSPRGISGNKLSLGWILLGVLQFSPVSIVSRILRTH